MKKFLLFLTSIFNVYANTECKYAPIAPIDRRPSSNTFRLVQYNVEWLFIDQYKDCPGLGCTWANKIDANIHMNWVANVLNDLNADYINFCEIEGCDELNMLHQLTNIDYKPYLIKGTDTATGQNVGILTKVDPTTDLHRTNDKVKYPVPESTCGYTSTGTYGVSKHYMTTLNLNNINIAIIGAHLLAIPTEKSRCSEREAQAQVLQNQIVQLLGHGYEVIVLGDMNDYDNENLDLNNVKPTSKVLDILKGLEGTYKNNYYLNSVASLIPQNQRYTEWWDNNNNCREDKTDFSMIDHILMTDKLFNSISNAYIYHGYTQYCGTYNSDHFPVVVDFEF
jgi:exonuclease III